MDAMALLCTLHADGPATLKRLRQAGCTSLDLLCGLDDARLASMLATTTAAARRLQREAELLRERLAGSGDAAGGPVRRADERHGAPAPSPHASPEPSARSAGGDPREERSAESPGESLPIDGVELESRERRLMARVLETWRARDAEDDGASSATAAPAPAAPSLASSSASARQGSGTPLRAHALDGLDAELCAALLARGIQTLEELAASDPVDLVGDLGVGYSRLARLTALARRGTSAAKTPTATPAKFSRAELPFASAPRSSGPLDAELADALKNAPARAPKDGSAINADSGREGAGGPFV